MDKKKTSDEQPRRKIAKRVITPKQRYFVPSHGVSVDAVDAKSAVVAATKINKQNGDGDAE